MGALALPKGNAGHVTPGLNSYETKTETARQDGLDPTGEAIGVVNEQYKRRLGAVNEETGPHPGAPGAIDGA